MSYYRHSRIIMNLWYTSDQIFTASEKDYADAIIDYIDPSHYITHRIYRNSCIERDGFGIKDLRILNRKLSNCVIVDNMAISFKEQLDNGIYVKTFCGDLADNSLLEIQQFLMEIKDCADIREPLKETYFMSELYQEYKEKSLHSKLYSSTLM